MPLECLGSTMGLPWESMGVLGVAGEAQGSTRGVPCKCRGRARGVPCIQPHWLSIGARAQPHCHPLKYIGSPPAFLRSAYATTLAYHRSSEVLHAFNLFPTRTKFFEVFEKYRGFGANRRSRIQDLPSHSCTWFFEVFLSCRLLPQMIDAPQWYCMCWSPFAQDLF